MSIDVVRERAVATVRMFGEIDIATSGRMSDALMAEIADAPEVLIVDLEPVRFLDSTGLSALARANRVARDGGTEMRVAASGRMIWRMFEITGLIDELNVFGSYAEALAGRPGPPVRTC